MADILNSLDAKQQAINRRRALALALQEQAFDPLQAPRIPGAAISPLEGLAKLAQIISGAYQNSKLDKEQAALSQQMQAQKDTRAQTLAQALTPQAPQEQVTLPEQNLGLPIPLGDTTMMNPPSEAALAQRETRKQSLAAALASPDPMDQKIGDMMIQDIFSQGKEERSQAQQEKMARLVDALSGTRQAQQARLEAQLQREDPLRQAELLKALTPPARNIDPLSPEGIKARLEYDKSAPQAQRNIDPLSPEGIKARLDYDRQAPKAPKEERIVQVMGPNGTPIWVRESEAVGKPAAQAPRAVTGQERQALAFYNRAAEAVATITAPVAGGESLENTIAKSGTAQQLRGQYAPNIMQSPEQQSYRQAQRAFTEARLRKESGAAIPMTEYENDARTYFAQPGDSLKVIEQKRKARQTVLDGLKFSSGKAYDEFYGEAASKPGGDLKSVSTDDLLKRLLQ